MGRPLVSYVSESHVEVPEVVEVSDKSEVPVSPHGLDPHYSFCNIDITISSKIFRYTFDESFPGELGSAFSWVGEESIRKAVSQIRTPSRVSGGR